MSLDDWIDNRWMPIITWPLEQGEGRPLPVRFCLLLAYIAWFVVLVPITLPLMIVAMLAGTLEDMKQ